MRRLIVDTNVLYRLDLCQTLSEKIAEGQLEVFVPTIIHAERIRQVADWYGENFSIGIVRQFIEDHGFQIIEFSVKDAEEVAQAWVELKEECRYSKQEWRTHYFDILLCAVARSRSLQLITDDEKGLSLPKCTESHDNNRIRGCIFSLNLLWKYY